MTPFVLLLQLPALLQPPATCLTSGGLVCELLYQRPAHHPMHYDCMHACSPKASLEHHHEICCCMQPHMQETASLKKCCVTAAAWRNYCPTQCNAYLCMKANLCDCLPTATTLLYPAAPVGDCIPKKAPRDCICMAEHTAPCSALHASKVLQQLSLCY
jgi:hypothetical protein